MSHFTVLVIGEDVEASLAPFHEYECTGYDDEYVQNVDLMSEARAEFTRMNGAHGEVPRTFADFCNGWYGLKPVVGDAPSLVEDHKYGWMRATADGDVVELVKRTNPNAHWDWWVVGGRWPNRLLLKGGGAVDRARKSDVDFDRIRSTKEAESAKHYDEVHGIIAARDVVTWSQTRALHPDDIDAARKEYHAQPVVRDLRERKVLGFSEPVEDLLLPRDIYLASARDEAILTHGVVKDGQWFERGRMGWFACVSNEKDADQWAREFNALIDGLPDDTMLTVVDCHI